LFPAANILLALFLLTAFFAAARNVIQTFFVAHMSALSNLAPQPRDYLWQLNNRQVAVDKKKIRYYADYYENLLQVFPSLKEINGLLGYCYHYMGDDQKAVEYLNKGISYDPQFSWNYYDLAMIYVQESRYQEALLLLQKLHTTSPKDTITRIYTSRMVYLPLVEAGGKDGLLITVDHIKQSYQDSRILIQLLDQTGRNDQIKTLLKQIKLELYAF